MKKCFIFFLLFVATISSFGQFGYNPNVVKPVLEDDVMFRKYVTRYVNLKEKQNLGFRADGYDFATSVIEAAKNGRLTTYKPNQGINIVEQIDKTEKFEGRDANNDPVVVDSVWINPVIYVDAMDPNGTPIKVPSRGNLKTREDITGLEILEEVVFDKRRSRMYINIISITLVHPGGDTRGAVPSDKFIATFKYKELDKYMRELYVTSNQKMARWYNPKNERRHMCVMDAFELRLFSSRIVKVSNPDNKFLSEITNNNITDELYKAQEAEMELMEFEHNLWEF